MKDSRAPVAVSAPVSPVSVKQNYTQPLSNNSGNPHNHEAWQAASFVLGLENHFAADDNIPNPTQFGALRIKTMTIENVHNAISTGQASPGTLLAVALLAAWGRVRVPKMYHELVGGR